MRRTIQRLRQQREHTPPPQLSQILPHSDVEMGTASVPVPVPEDAMEVNALCEETVDPPDMEAFFDAAGEIYDHYTGEMLDRDATIVGIRAELTQMQEFGVFEWQRKSEKPPNEKARSTKMFHKAKGDEVRSRIVAREFADGVFASEHRGHATHVGTEVGDQQNDVEGSYTSACVTRCVNCILPCLARERRVGERWLTLVCGETG